MNYASINGKVVLVTGGAKGIGRELTGLLAFSGAEVYICGRDLGTLNAVSKKMNEQGCKVKPVQTDVRDSGACKRLIEKIKTESGRLDAVINNAGMSMRGSLEESEPEVIRAMFEINTLGAAYISHYAIPMLKNTGGSVIFISSLSALHGLPKVGPYGASKQALTGMSESLRAELHSEGVHVGIVYVSFTENDPQKVLYNSDGSMTGIKRSRNIHSQKQVSEKIVKCLLKRKKVMTLSAFGKIAAILYRFFPALSDAVISKFASKNKMYN